MAAPPDSSPPPVNRPGDAAVDLASSVAGEEDPGASIDMVNAPVAPAPAPPPAKPPGAANG